MDEFQVLHDLIVAALPVFERAPICMVFNTTAITWPANEQIRSVPFEPARERAVTARPCSCVRGIVDRIHEAASNGFISEAVALHFDNIRLTVDRPQLEI